MSVYTFSRNSTERIARAVRSLEGPRDRVPAGWWSARPAAASSLVLCKTSSPWMKGTIQTLAVHKVADQTATGGTVTAINLAADIESGKWCGVQNGMLCWAECDDPPAGA